jgi:NAD(P)-dependent dehydrogenase (short-subunit alcohol dehydrogenase family)
VSFEISDELLGLTDKVALVTGGAMGIGKGCAVRLAQAGCHIVIADMNMEVALRTAAEIEALGRRAAVVEADVRDETSVATMVAGAIRALGPIDVACNVVGNLSHSPKPFLDLTLDEWNATVHRNLGTTFLCTKIEAIAMIERSIPGRIINVASSSGVVGGPNVADYGAANAGVIHFTKSAAMELARFGLRVNCIIPGTHETESSRARAADSARDPNMQKFREMAAKAPPLGRLGDPLDTGGLAVFLASNLSAYVTGHGVFSDGGVVHTTARPPVGMDMMPAALAHIGDK